MFLESKTPTVSARSRERATTRPPTPDLASIATSPHLDNDPPPLSALQSNNPHHQQITDDITRKVNDLVLALTQPQAYVAVPHATEAMKAVGHLSDKQDKENQTADDESWSHVSAEVSHSSGIGLGVELAEGRAVGRDLANAGPTVSKARKDKEKKARRQYFPPKVCF
jgi:hypothetical protein